LNGTDFRLIHSRFRPHERKLWHEAFLNRQACAPGTDRIVVATQVVEAGVDISAGVLITDLAPWPSLVQRFGRCARWGGTAQVHVVDFAPKDDKAAAPYSTDELSAARHALTLLEDVAPLHLERFEDAHAELLPALYPFEPRNLLLRHELDELFDTTPDLTGADIDISRFIRSGDECDVLVFWREVEKSETPDAKTHPVRNELCAVPYRKVRDWLCGKENATTRAPRLKDGMRAWVWDWLEGRWRTVERRDLYPGQTVFVAAECGGYDPETGWAPEHKPALSLPSAPVPSPEELADASQDDESLSAYPWKSIATHGRETGVLARAIASSLDEQLAGLFDLAGRWHDAGKVFPAFQNSIQDSPTRGRRPAVRELAKAPEDAWLHPARLYPMDGSRRPGFRHELISVLALFSVLQRHRPDHPALLGPWRELFEQIGANAAERIDAEQPPPTALEQEILALDADRFNLLAYLVCCHHGKLRVAWHATPADQEASSPTPRLRGIEEEDQVPPIRLCDASGAAHALAGFAVSLDLAAAGLSPSFGPSWTERVLGLLRQHGPFALAWMEALLRAADQRASRDSDTSDPFLHT
jgi:CRISPR-associated endonuclease/helicase Cas3